MSSETHTRQTAVPSNDPPPPSRRSRTKWTLFRYALVFVLGVLAAWFWWGGREGVPAVSGGPSPEEGSQAEAAEPRTWSCSMHPQIRQPSPGKCPICGMDLIPVTATAGGLRTLTVSPEARGLMDIETAPVERKYVQNTIRMVGKVDYDETKLGYITAWVAGRLDRLYVDYTGIQVKEGDHMVYIYSEQLYAAQEELIQALKYKKERPRNTGGLGVTDIDLVQSARTKLRLLGLKKEQIREIEERGTPSDHLTIYSPVSGIVIEKLKQEGQRVALGDRIYTIADLSQVWVHLDAYETDLPWIRYGQDVTITTESYPGDQFHGRIAFIQPVLNDETRTVKVRVNAPNQDGKLKPEMFVHAVVRPRVAAGGRVMDPSLAGKWIGPMHPEVVREQPGTCGICGMPLVRAESLGFVTPETDEREPPLVIPYRAALVTGTRAVVYVQLPLMQSTAEPALTTLSYVLSQQEMDEIREAFKTYAEILSQPYDQPGTDYATTLWGDVSDKLVRHAKTGQRAENVDEAHEAFAAIEKTMGRIRERFAAPGTPTFEGHEIVLGPRAGDYYIVRHGLQEGEIVVKEGNFKIDAEIQIQAKPSMMTPQGGGGGGPHQHGESPSEDETSDGGDAAHTMSLPSSFRQGVRDLEAAYDRVTVAVENQDPGNATAAFARFGEALNAVDASGLTGQPRAIWKEFSMLLGNDAFEGRHAEQLPELERLHHQLQSHMQRMRQRLGVSPAPQADRPTERIAVPAEFQRELAALWERYLALQNALAADSLEDAREALTGFASALATVEATSLDPAALKVWKREQDNLATLIERLQQAEDLEAIRAEFLALSQEIGVLAKSFGFGEAGPVYELHCPMAFQGKGAIWYQDSSETRNPYYGSTMLKCADRVERLVHDEPPLPKGPQAQDEGHQEH